MGDPIGEEVGELSCERSPDRLTEVLDLEVEIAHADASANERVRELLRLAYKLGIPRCRRGRHELLGDVPESLHPILLDEQKSALSVELAHETGFDLRLDLPAGQLEIRHCRIGLPQGLFESFLGFEHPAQRCDEGLSLRVTSRRQVLADFPYFSLDIEHRRRVPVALQLEEPLLKSEAVFSEALDLLLLLAGEL